MVLVTVISYRELLPAFFIQGTGGTSLRQMVIGTAALLFLGAGIMNFIQYQQSGSALLYWYSLGLLLLSLGTVVIFMQSSLGTPLN